MNKNSQVIENLNNENGDVRLESLWMLMDKIDSGEIQKPQRTNDVNNHIHTTYSFSPYSPAKAIWMAYNSGLATAGIMDHDSISGAREFIKAGQIAGMATTIGVECRVDVSKTPLVGKRINNPDQESIAYITMHGIPHTQIDKVKEYFSPLLQRRNNRNRLMVTKINNDILKPFGIKMDFDTDVSVLSKYREGGSITERHISLALARKLIETCGKGQKLIDFLKAGLKIAIGQKMERYLLDVDNEYYEYDLLGLIKSDLVESFYIDATDECPDIRDIISFSKSIGAVSAYPYLGDVRDSVTGDKRSQSFEDSYLDLLFRTIKDLGFNAVTYMPSRNTPEQLERLRNLCDQFDFFQISGEDINSPRQPFICDALKKPEYGNLIDSTWALIGHETLATGDLSGSMFSPDTVLAYPNLNDRIAKYKEIGLNQAR